MEIQQTLIIIKTDAIERGLIGEVTSRFERAGLKIIAMKMIKATEKMASDHYGDFVERYTSKLGLEMATNIKKNMVGFLTSGPVVPMVVEGVRAVEVVRKIVGSTYPNEALPGTIRGDYAHISQAHANNLGVTVKNLVHASGNEEEAKIEVAHWFKKEELVEYTATHSKHTIE